MTNTLAYYGVLINYGTKRFDKTTHLFFEIERQNILFSVEKSEVSFDVFWEIYLIKLSGSVILQFGRES